MAEKTIKVGTSGYSYPGVPPKGWYGVFYPRPPARNFGELEYYSSFFDAVEINTTFYRSPSPSMTAAWAKKTPADFEFAVKAWQKFTHAKRLGEETRKENSAWPPPSEADVDLFNQGIGPLADSGKLGVLLFQFPPSFHYTEENVGRIGWLLRVFHNYPKAIELRHRSWSDQQRETRSLLEPAGAAWAVIDEPRFASSVGRAAETTSEIFYLRLHGRNREKWWNHQEAWERYDYLYSSEEIRSLGQKIHEKARQSPRAKLYVFFNNHARGQAVANGLMLKHELGQGATARLPEELVHAYPQLGTINLWS